MAASHDITLGGNTRMAWTEEHAVQRLTRVVDVAAVITADGGSDLASSTKITAAESLAVVDIPDNTWVIQVVARIITACTDATATIDIGDDGDPEGYMATFDITGSAGTNDWAEDDADGYSLQYKSGELYSVADQIDVLFNNDTTDGIFVVMVLCANFRYQYKDPTTFVSSNV